MANRCACCGKTVGDRHHLLERRVEVLRPGASGVYVTVLASDGGTAYCGLACWSRHQPEIFAQLGLSSCYTAYSAIARCSCCDGPVDRRHVHVVYAVLDVTRSPVPWLADHKVHSNEEFAVLCTRCQFPDLEQDGETSEGNGHTQSERLDVYQAARSHRPRAHTDKICLCSVWSVDQG